MFAKMSDECQVCGILLLLSNHFNIISTADDVTLISWYTNHLNGSNWGNGAQKYLSFMGANSICQQQRQAEPLKGCFIVYFRRTQVVIDKSLSKH